MPLIQSLAVSLLACAAHCLAPAALADSSQPGPFAVSQRTVTITRASGTTFTAQIRYPASSAAANAPFATAAAPAPAITFGHGFLSAVDLYDSTMDHLASHGYIVIATSRPTVRSPGHSPFRSAPSPSPARVARHSPRRFATPHRAPPPTRRSQLRPRPRRRSPSATDS